MSATMVVATPYWSVEKYILEEFACSDEVGRINMCHFINTPLGRMPGRFPHARAEFNHGSEKVLVR